jgi:hypothetical protein
MDANVENNESNNEKPLIEITSCPVATTIKNMVIAGTIHCDKPNLQLFINSEEQKILSGRFMAPMPLEDGPNDFEIVLVDEVETLAKEFRSIFCGFLPPVLKVDELPDVTAQTEITLCGTGVDVNQHKSLLTLKINNEQVDINPENGAWEKTYPLSPGTNHFDILLYDGALRKSVVHEIIEHHPEAPEIVFSGIGPVITCRQMEFVGKLSNFDPNTMAIRVHEKIVPVSGDSFRYKTSIRTDKAVIPIAIDRNGHTILNFSRPVVFIPSPPTVTVDAEIMQIGSDRARISGTIKDENDINPVVIVGEKEILPRAGVWNATLTLTSGINNIVIIGKNNVGLKTTVKKKIFVP